MASRLCSSFSRLGSGRGASSKKLCCTAAGSSVMAWAVTVSIRTGWPSCQLACISRHAASARSRARWVLMGSRVCRVMVLREASRTVSCTAPAHTPWRRRRAATSSERAHSAECTSAAVTRSRGKVRPLPTLFTGSFSPQRRTGASSSPRA